MGSFSDYLADDLDRNNATEAANAALQTAFTIRSNENLKDLAKALSASHVPAKPMYSLKKTESILGIFGGHRGTRDYYELIGHGWVLESPGRDDYTPIPGSVLSTDGDGYRWDDHGSWENREVHGIDPRYMTTGHYGDMIAGTLTMQYGPSIPVSGPVNDSLVDKERLEALVSDNMAALARLYRRLTET